MSWLQYVQINMLWIVFKYARTDRRSSWGKPTIRHPRLEDNKLWLPRSAYMDAGYIDLDKHEIVYNEGVEEYGKIPLQMMFDKLNQLK